MENLADVSTYEYFLAIITAVIADNRHITLQTLQLRCEILLSGLATSASTGSSALASQVRSAFYAVLSHASHTAVFDLANALLVVIQSNLNNDRLLLPLLDLTSFLLDARILQRIAGQADAGSSPFKWRTFLSLVQKSHFKSSSMPKLFVAIQIYRSIAYENNDGYGSEATGPAIIRPDAVKKLIELCGHPFPKVCTPDAI